VEEQQTTHDRRLLSLQLRLNLTAMSVV
jgi:hypothetical protein